MKFTKFMAGVAFVIYLFLWFLAFHGVTSLYQPLAVPLILAVLVAVLVWFQKFMGFKPKSPKYREPKDPKDPE
jgi:fatty acid desaturase